MTRFHFNFELTKIILIKLLIILIVGVFYTVVIANYNNQLSTDGNKPLGVCVFDIDATLNCKGAFAAVAVCKNAGFALAINTARSKSSAYKIIQDGTLLSKGFDSFFIELARHQDGLNGPFQYSEGWSYKQPAEQILQTKSYGMRNIAKYYNFKTDDKESRRIVLFDDLMHNIVQMQPNPLEPYSNSNCKIDNNGDCYSRPSESPFDVVYPRNWKIYRSKWVGYVCTRWDNPDIAAKDAMEVVYDIIYGEARALVDNESLEYGKHK